MRKGTPIILLMLISNLVMFLLVPRFGWTLRDGSTAPYRFAGHRREAGLEIDTYKKSDDALTVAYTSKFSRDLNIQLNEEEPLAVQVQIDGGMSAPADLVTDTDMGFVLSNIIWKDSSGIFLYRCALYIAAIALYALCFMKAENAQSKRGKVVCLALSLSLFTLASLMILRVIL